MSTDTRCDAANSGSGSLSEKDTRMIKRYCICPRLAVVALIMAFALAVPFILGEMIGDLVFYGRGDFRFIGWAVWIGLFVLYVAIFCYCALAAKFGMLGKRWKALVERLSVQQSESDYTAGAGMAVGTLAAGGIMRDSDNNVIQSAGDIATVAGAVGSAAVASKQMAAIGNKAKAVAKAYGVAIPNNKRAIIVMIVAPLLIMGAAYGVRYASAAEAMHACQTVASTQIEHTVNAFELAGLHADIGSDPAESYDDSGYWVYGYISGKYHSENGVEVRINIDNNGQVTYVNYEKMIDPEKSLEENLIQTQADFATLGEALSTADVQAKMPELLDRHTLSDDFCQQFLAGDIYTDMRTNDRANDCSIVCSFRTEEAAKFDEYTHPRIQLTIS